MQLAGVYTVLLLLLSNSFMTFAWYGHLKFRSLPLWVIILVSWGIAFFEYCLQVPANRLGVEVFDVYQLKIIQEALALLVFVIFAALYFGEGINLRYGISLTLILAAVAVAFYK